MTIIEFCERFRIRKRVLINSLYLPKEHLRYHKDVEVVGFSVYYDEDEDIILNIVVTSHDFQHIIQDYDKRRNDNGITQ